MSETTYFGSRVQAGAVLAGNPAGNMPGTGDLVLSQSVLLVGLLAGGNTDGQVTLPPGAQILQVLAAKQVNQAGGTASTLLVTGGLTAGAAQYLGSTDLFTNTNAAGPPATVAGNLAAANIGANTTVNFRVALNGTVTTPPQVRFTVNYVMRS